METFDVIVKKCGTYNCLVECIVQADELNTPSKQEEEKAKQLSVEDEEKLHQGIKIKKEEKNTSVTILKRKKNLFIHFLGFIATEFLKDTATQLTYYGLELLLDSIPIDTLCVLFRNNHVGYIHIFYL